MPLRLADDITATTAPHAADTLALLDALPAAIAFLDNTGRLAWANAAWGAMAGAFTQDDFAVLQPPLNELLAGRRMRIDVDVPATPQAGRGSCRIVGTPRPGGGATLHAAPLSGAIGGTHERDAYFRALFDNALDGIVILDDAARFRAVNPAAAGLLGALPEQVQGSSLFELSPADLEPMLQSQWAAFLRDGAQTGVMRAPVPGGTRSVEFTARANFVPGRHLAHLRDVTERVQMEEQLRHSQKLEAIGQLTGGIAHDFNNLLTIILANASLAMDLLADDAGELRPLIGEMQSSAASGAQMVRKLLAFARRETLALGLVQLPALLGDLARTLRRLLPTSIDVRLDEPRGAGFVRADAGAVEQILLNLATNARDAMPDGGTLRLAVADVTLGEDECTRMPWARPGTYVRFSVIDSGMGMSPETRARVFEPFFTTKPRGSGTGLGMPMIYGLVQQHDGGIAVESELGKGTAVHVYFPAASAEDRVVPAGEAPSPAAMGHEAILLAEDEELVQRAAVRVLRKQGYRVYPAADGEQAEALFRAHIDEIRLVITDIVMPRMGGRRLVEAVRALRPDTPILCTSGYAERSGDMERALPDGVPFLHKPWRTADLLAQVRQLLDAPRPLSA